MNGIMMQNQNVNGQSYIEITNSGWYLAEFYITYIVSRENIDTDSGIFPIGQTRRLYIAPGTPEVILKVDVWIFGGGTTLYNDYVDTSSSNCYNLTGTIFNPSIDQIQCSDNSSCCNYNQVCNPYSCSNCTTCNKNTIQAKKIF